MIIIAVLLVKKEDCNEKNPLLPDVRASDREKRENSQRLTQAEKFANKSP